MALDGVVMYRKKPVTVAVAEVLGEPYTCRNPGKTDVVAHPGEFVVNPGSDDEYPITAERLAELYTSSTSAMDYGDALRAIKAGKKVTRAAWAGRGHWLQPLLQHPPLGATESPVPTVGLILHQLGAVLTTYLPALDDMLAVDWMEVA